MSFALSSGTFTDPQGETLTYSASGLPAGVTFNASTLTFSGTAPATPGAYTITMTATDTSGLSASETFTATIPTLPPNAAKAIAAQTWTEDKAVSFAIPSGTFTDPQNEALTYTATLSNGQSLPSWLTLNATTGAFSGTPTATAVLAITVTATDTSGLSASEILDVSIVAPAPTVANHTANQTVTANEAVSFSLAPNTFSAMSGQTLAYKATEPAWLTFNPTTGTFTGTAPATRGTSTVTVTATQTSGLSVAESFTITVGAAAPTIASQTPKQSWNANEAVSLSLAGTFTDPQGEALRYSVSGLPDV